MGYARFSSIFVYKVCYDMDVASCKSIIHMYAQIYISIYVCICTCTSPYVYICIYVYMYICIHVCVYIYMYLCIYVYIYINVQVLFLALDQGAAATSGALAADRARSWWEWKEPSLWFEG